MKNKTLTKEIILKKYSIKKDLIYILSFIFFSVLFEVLLFVFLGFGFFPKYVLFNLSYLIFVSLILFAIPSFLVKKILILTLLTLQCVFCILNSSLYELFGDLFSFDMLAIGTEAMVSMEFSVLNWLAIGIFFALTIGIYFFYILFDKKYKMENIDINARTSLMITLVLMMSIVLGVGTNRVAYHTIDASTFSSEESEEVDFSDSELYNSLQFKVSAYKKFGTFGFYIKNVANLINIESPSEIAEKIQNTKNYLTKSEYAITIDDGEYFGISKNNNVISILLESFDIFGIDPYTTPTLYALVSNNNIIDKTMVDNNEIRSLIADNTLYLSEFYGRNKTNHAETLSIAGNYAKETQFSRSKKPIEISKDYNFDFTLPKMLKKSRGSENIETIYLHANESEFYGRSGYMNMFGFNKTYYTDTMDNIGGDIPSNFYDFVVEEDLVKAQKDSLIPILENDKTFYTQYSTITTHGSYAKQRDRIQEKGYYEIVEENWEKICDYIQKTFNGYFVFNDDFKDTIVNYKASMIDLDRALYVLFEDLVNKGLQNNTTIMLYSDHYVYYNSIAASVRGYEGNRFEYSDLYNIPCMIFDLKLVDKLKSNGEDLDFDKFSNAHNIVPTLLDLLGIEYNSAYYTGYSLFNKFADKTGYVSYMNGILDNNYFSFDLNELYYEREGATEEDYKKYVQNAKIFLEKQSYIEILYKYNVNQYLVKK